MKKVFRYLNTFLLLSSTTMAYALPFAITPARVLPTQISAGQTSTAYYTVTNNTVSTRLNNFIKYLPPNVTQITGDASVPNICGPTFNLAPHGNPGDSCTLALRVTGPVNASDPDPHHHLFACFPGGLTCAGTNYPLNVNSGTGTRFAYFINRGSNSLSICLVNPNGSLGQCTNQQNTTFNQPSDIVINNNATLVYVANAANNTVSICNLNPTGLIGNCVALHDTTFDQPRGVNINNGILYVSNFANSTVSSCPILPNGLLNPCTANNGGGLFSQPNGKVSFNPFGNLAFIANYSISELSICSVTPEGLLTNCSNTTAGGLVNLPLGTFVHPSGSALYVINGNNTNILLICPILNSTGALGPCTQSNGNGTFDFNDFFSRSPFVSSTLGYFPNVNNTASLCSVDPNSGLLGACAVHDGSGTFSDPSGVWLTFTN